MNSTIIHPDYLCIVERKASGWLFKKSQFFARNQEGDLDPNNTIQRYGTTHQKVALELFRLNGGKTGYYIADLLHQQYYYCGREIKDVKNVFQNLGIGRADLMEETR